MELDITPVIEPIRWWNRWFQKISFMDCLTQTLGGENMHEVDMSLFHLRTVEKSRVGIILQVSVTLIETC